MPDRDRGKAPAASMACSQHVLSNHHLLSSSTGSFNHGVFDIEYVPKASAHPFLLSFLFRARTDITNTRARAGVIIRAPDHSGLTDDIVISVRVALMALSDVISKDMQRTTPVSSNWLHDLHHHVTSSHPLASHQEPQTF